MQAVAFAGIEGEPGYCWVVAGGVAVGGYQLVHEEEELSHLGQLLDMHRHRHPPDQRSKLHRGVRPVAPGAKEGFKLTFALLLKDFGPSLLSPRDGRLDIKGHFALAF